jgi:hypothetical protein
VGTVIEEKSIMELPLNGRNFFSLVALSPNVTYGFTPAAQAGARLGGQRASLTIATAGSRSTLAELHLDGITNTDVDFNTYILQPSVDALQEFKVQTGVYPAEFGREAGQVNVSTKPGTNTFHGTMSEFLRNDKLDARDYDFSAATRNATNPSPGRNPNRQTSTGTPWADQLGFPRSSTERTDCFSCPIGRGSSRAGPPPKYSSVLTQEMRSGDFSSIIPGGFRLADPLDARRDVPQHHSVAIFPTTRSPANRLSTGSKLLLHLFHYPTTPPLRPDCPTGITSGRKPNRTTETPSPNASISPKEPTRNGLAATVGTTNPRLRRSPA